MSFVICTLFAFASLIGACANVFFDKRRCRVLALDLYLLIFFASLFNILDPNYKTKCRERFLNGEFDDKFDSNPCDGKGRGRLAFFNEPILSKHNDTHIMKTFQYSELLVSGICTEVIYFSAHCFEEVDEDPSYCLDQPCYMPQEDTPRESWNRIGMMFLFFLKYLYLLVAKTAHFFVIIFRM